MHEIICGNSVDIMQDLIEAHKGKDIVIVTDPPFNIGYHYGVYKDKINEASYYKMLGKVMGGGIPAVVVHYPESLYKIAFELGRAPDRVVSWVYNSNTGRQHRDIAFFGIKPDFRQVKQPYKNPTDKRIKKRIADGKCGCKLYDWWNVNQVKNVSKVKTEHPCQMPLEVMRNIIGILPININRLVIDPFCGSGTTGVACKIANVDFIGIDIDPQYCNISKNRMLNYREETQ